MTSSSAGDVPGSDSGGAGAEHSGHFKRALGLVDAVAVVVGSMIGSGIFIVSADIARQVGSSGWLLACWLLAGLLTIIGALCYSELAAMFPKAGGQYVFLREAYGSLSGFLYGWTLFAVIQCGTIAAVGVAFAKFLGVFVPWVSNQNILMQVGGWKLTVLQLVSVALITLLTFVNCRGIEAAKLVQTSFTATKLAALALLIVLGLCSTDKFAGAAVNFQNMWDAQTITGEPLTGLTFLAVLGLAMVGSLFSCDAWNNITFAGEEVKDAEKILPKSLALGTLLVITVYILANVVYLLLIPLHGAKDGGTIAARGIQFALEDRVGTAAAEVIFGAPGKGLMAAAIMVSTFGCLNGLILAGARVYYAMAKDGLFFRKAALLDEKTNVPVFGLVIQGVWSAILATSGAYGALLDYVVFAALLFYVLTVIAVIRLRKDRPDAVRPYKVWGYPFLPILYVVAAVAVMAGQLYGAPALAENIPISTAGASFLVILSGLPAYFIWQKKSKEQKSA